jgi:hypothetical protein
MRTVGRIMTIRPHARAAAGYAVGMTHELDAADRNEMPDSEYAFPRLRKEPLNDASHVRNAIARFDQVQDATDDERREAFERIRRAAGRFDVELSATNWRELGKPSSPDQPRRTGQSTKDDLYEEAKRRNIKGRSGMTKAQLERALGR